MSTEIKTKLKGKSLVQFWGGNQRGTMLQITGNHGYVQFDLQEVAEVVKVFSNFILETKKERT